MKKTIITLTVHGLRGELRKIEPKLPAAFTSTANRDECLDLLNEKKSREQVLKAWAKRVSR